MGLSKAKAALAVAAAGGLAATAALVIPGTFGNFSASTSNLNNSITAGTLQMTNSKGTGAIVTVSSSPGMRPGDVNCGQTTITNSGSLSASGVAVKEANLVDKDSTGATITTGSLLSGDLNLKVYEDATGFNSSTCAITGTPIYNAAFGSFSTTGLSLNSGNSWAHNDAHTYTFVVTFPNSSGVGADNAYQGESATADFTWTSQS